MEPSSSKIRGAGSGGGTRPNLDSNGYGKPEESRERSHNSAHRALRPKRDNAIERTALDVSTTGIRPYVQTQASRKRPEKVSRY